MALLASAWLSLPIVTMPLSTNVQRALAASGCASGSYSAGDRMLLASTAPSEMLSFETSLPK